MIRMIGLLCLALIVGNRAASADGPELFFAAARLDALEVRRQLELGVDPNEPLGPRATERLFGVVDGRSLWFSQDEFAVMTPLFAAICSWSPLDRDRRPTRLGEGNVGPLSPIGRPEDRDAIIEMLLQHGANPNATLPNGMSPLIQTIEGYRDLKTVRLLIKYQADVNAPYTQHAFCGVKSGLTPLHRSTSEPEITALLLQAGANPFAVDEDGDTPYSRAFDECRQVYDRHFERIARADSKQSAPASQPATTQPLR